MNYSKNGIALTEQFEGCKYTAYLDQVGVPTIGYGHISGVKIGDACTPDQADVWLQEDIQHVVNQLNNDLTIHVTQGEFDALVDFGFNLGLHALEASTLWTMVMAGDFDGAAAQFPRWDHAGGKEVAGLLRRRLQEQAEFKA